MMSGIPRRVTLLCLQVLSDIFSLSLGGDVSDDWGVGAPAGLCRLPMSSSAVKYLD